MGENKIQKGAGNLFYEILSNWNVCDPKFRGSKTPNEMKKIIKNILLRKVVI